MVIKALNVNKLNKKTLNFIPVVSHDLVGYDMHHIIRALGKLPKVHGISVIPQTGEKYLSLNISVYITTRRNKNGNMFVVRENLRFIDSLQFTKASLDKLVQYLPEESLSPLHCYFADYPYSSRKLLCQKGYYPYSYMDSFEKFKETCLPPLEFWNNMLTNKCITPEQLAHAEKVCSHF